MTSFVPPPFAPPPGGTTPALTPGFADGEGGEGFDYAGLWNFPLDPRTVGALAFGVDAASPLDRRGTLPADGALLPNWTDQVGNGDAKLLDAVVAPNWRAGYAVGDTLNHVPNPKLGTGASFYGSTGPTASRQAGADLPGFAWAWVSAAMTSGALTRMYHAWAPTTLVVGQTYTASMWVKASAAVALMFAQVQDGGGGNTVNGANTALAANTWVRVQSTFVYTQAMATQGTLRVGVSRPTSGTETASLSITGLMLQPGAYADPAGVSYIDGGLASGLYTWSGVADASPTVSTTSIGPRVAWNGTQTNQQLNSAFSLLQPSGGMSMYAVVATRGAPAATETVVDGPSATIGGSSATRLLVQQINTGAGRCSDARATTNYTGSANDLKDDVPQVLFSGFDVPVLRGRSKGRPLASTATGTPLPSIAGLTVGSGFNGNGPWVGDVSAVYLFNQTHDTQTRFRIEAWLQQRFGAAPLAGVA